MLSNNEETSSKRATDIYEKYYKSYKEVVNNILMNILDYSIVYCYFKIRNYSRITSTNFIERINKKLEELKSQLFFPNIKINSRYHVAMYLIKYMGI